VPAFAKGKGFTVTVALAEPVLPPSVPVTIYVTVEVGDA
jgi:hypothetical protein